MKHVIIFPEDKNFSGYVQSCGTCAVVHSYTVIPGIKQTKTSLNSTF